MDDKTDQSEFRYSGRTPGVGAYQDAVGSEDGTKNSPAPRTLIEWNASEFVDHQKGFAWFLPFVLVVVCATGLGYLLTRSIMTSVVVLAGALAFGFYAHQKPRTIAYKLRSSSIKVGDKSYSYDDFRSFSIIQEDALFSILLEPLRRFMPPLTVYFPPDQGQQIFETLAQHLPHVERQLDPIERLMKKIRF